MVSSPRPSPFQGEGEKKTILTHALSFPRRGGGEACLYYYPLPARERARVRVDYGKVEKRTKASG